MRDLVILFVHLIVTLARLAGPGGVRSVVAESVLVKHQLVILNRSRKRAPHLRVSDRIVAGLCALLMRPARIIRSAITLKPSTLLNLHHALKTRKYRLLFSPKRRRKPGPKGPSQELVEAVIEMKQRNPSWGCPRIAQQIALAFGIQIDKDVVRRILDTHYWPKPDAGGPSWLTFIGHLKDSLWSIDLFRCESVTLRTHWVLVVMDQYTRRIIGFGVQAGTVNGVALCRMFNSALRGHRLMPKHLSSDHDPLYRFHQWQANLRILEVTEIKTVPYVPLSHPFVERLIGTIRREYLDRMLFWTSTDLENKLLDFRAYFNGYRTHTSREGRTPDTPVSRPVANPYCYRWQAHCRGLYQTPIAA
jgi:putative transposase